MNVRAKFLVGVSIGVAATVGCYALAATTAAHLAATLAPDPGAHHARMEEFKVQLHEGDQRYKRLGDPL